jgi:hypothetical protein
VARSAIYARFKLKKQFRPVNEGSACQRSPHSFPVAAIQGGNQASGKGNLPGA